MNNPTSLKEYLIAIPQFFGLIIRLAFDRRIPWETKAAMGGGLLYIISPIDGIPDFIPILGWAEDMLIGVMLLDGIINRLDRSIVLEHWRGRPEILQQAGRVSARIMAALPAFLRTRVQRKAFYSRKGKTAAPSTVTPTHA